MVNGRVNVARRWRFGKPAKPFHPGALVAHRLLRGQFCRAASACGCGWQRRRARRRHNGRQTAACRGVRSGTAVAFARRSSGNKDSARKIRVAHRRVMRGHQRQTAWSGSDTAAARTGRPAGTRGDRTPGAPCARSRCRCRPGNGRRPRSPDARVRYGSSGMRLVRAGSATKRFGSTMILPCATSGSSRSANASTARRQPACRASTR